MCSQAFYTFDNNSPVILLAISTGLSDLSILFPVTDHPIYRVSIYVHNIASVTNVYFKVPTFGYHVPAIAVIARFLSPVLNEMNFLLK